MGFIAFILLIVLLVTLFKYQKIKDNLKDSQEAYEAEKNSFIKYKKEMEHLKQYEVIDDAKMEAQNILQKAEEQLRESEFKYHAKIADAQEQSAKELSEAKIQAKQIKEKAEKELEEAHFLAGKIESEANAKAKEIAGDAWEAKKQAELYEATAKAMKNTIKGYGDEYLIPGTTLLDDLAEEYDHKQAGQDLQLIRAQIKSMIKNGEVADCNYVEEQRKNTAVNFLVDAFNGKVETIMAKVKHDNYGILLKKLEDAYNIVNYNGKAFRDARITERYFQLMVQQLKAAVIVKELKRRDDEEQRRIREEMREEERARKEYEKALKDAEKEERILQKALREAEAKLASAVAEEREQFEMQLKELQEKLRAAEDKGQRALSMAQQTKQGHVYIISNIGSFGDDVFKIGLTKRLEPMDRVKELGDASVPFSFDVHAMIFSEDAPKLEKELHSKFFDNQLNKVNPRKEFFKIPISVIREEIEKLGLTTHWTMKAEALEYRESIQLERKADLVKV